MRRLSAILPNDLVAIILIVCVSTCCCQTHFLVHGLSGDASGLTACAITSAPACCSNCAVEKEPPGDGEQSDSSDSGCKICCVKGTGAKDISPVIPPLALTSLPMLQVQVLLYAASTAFEMTTAVDELPLGVQPQTLVRLRCALLI